MNKPDKPPVTRIAPSPTGLFHIGTARTALFNWLYAQKHGGTFIIRIEDTDKVRSKPEYEKNILDGLEWLGLHADTIIRQSERVSIHKTYIEKLLESGHAFVSKEEKKVDEDGKEMRSEVIRFKNPGGTLTFHDEIRGLITFDTTELGDFVIAKSTDEPLYHLAVVVDDIEMGITHVIRGEDHISNTPRQVLLYRALGIEPPVYAHLPLILAPDRSKMSKRHGAVSIDDYRTQGYVKEALINFLGLLGFNPGDDREIYSLNEFVDVFSLDRIQKGGAIFDINRLKWFNRHYLRANNDEFFLSQLSAADARFESARVHTPLLASIVRERVELQADITNLATNGDLAYVHTRPQVAVSGLSWKGTQTSETIATHLKKVKELLCSLEKSEMSIEKIKAAIWPYAEEVGRGDVLWPLRYSLTGLDKSPDPFTVIALLGIPESIERIDAALHLCGE